MKVQMATMLKVFIGGMGVITLFVAMSQAFVPQEVQSLYVKAEPRTLALEMGSRGEFACLGQLNYTNNMIQWLYSDGSKIPSKHDVLPSQSSTITLDNGSLVIRNASLEDTDDYICATQDLVHRVNVTLRVYIMPSYRTEGIVLLVTNLLLLSVFFVCMVISKVQEHRMLRQYRAISKNTAMGRLSPSRRESIARSLNATRESHLADEAVGGVDEIVTDIDRDQPEKSEPRIDVSAESESSEPIMNKNDTDQTDQDGQRNQSDLGPNTTTVQAVIH